MKKIFDFFGFVPRVRVDELSEALRNRVNEVNDLKAKVIQLELYAEKYKSIHPAIKVDEDDPDIVSPELRKSYIARVAGFHHDIMGAKLKRLISQTREVVMSIGRDTLGYTQADFDIYLKGTENAYWMLHQWGEYARNEHIANGTEDVELSEDDVEILKDKIST